jgi:hypothetical protein
VGDKTIRLWNTGRPGDAYSSITIWKGLQAKVTCVSFHPSEEGVLAYGCENGKIGVYNTLKQTHVREYGGHKGSVYVLGWRVLAAPIDQASETFESGGQATVPVAAPNSFLYSLGADDSLLQARVERPRDASLALIKSLSKERKKTGFAWKPDGSLLAVGYYDGSVDIFHASDVPSANGTTTVPRLALLRTFRDQTKAVYSLCWNPHAGFSRFPRPGLMSNDGPAPMCFHHYWLACGSEDHTISVYDCTRVSGLLTSTPTTEAGTPETGSGAASAEAEPASFSPGSGSMCLLRGHNGPVKAVSWSPHDPTQLLSASGDGTAQVWDVVTSKPTVNLRGHSGRLFGACWSRLTKGVVFTGGEDQTARLWDLEQQPKAHVAPPSAKDVRSRRQQARPKKKESVRAQSKEPQVQAASVGALEEATVSAPVLAATGSKVPDHGALPPLPPPLGRKKPFLLPPVTTGCKPSYASCIKLVNELYAAGDAATSQDPTATSALMGTSEIRQYLSSPTSLAHVPAKEQEGSRQVLQLWQGQLGPLLQGVVDSGTITPHWVAMSMGAGRDVWVRMCGLYAQQMVAKGDVHTAVQYYVVCDQVEEAVLAYLKAHLFAEAVALARCRLLDEDPLVTHCYLVWARACEAKQQVEMAANCYLAARKPALAVHALTRTLAHDATLEPGALVAACAVAAVTRDPSATRLHQQLGLLRQAQGDWEGAVEAYAAYPELVPLQMFCRSEEVLARELRLGKSQGDPDEPKPESSIPLVNLVLQSWMMHGLPIDTDGAATALSALSQLNLAGFALGQRKSQVRTVVALGMARSCLLGLSSEAGCNSAASLQLLAECADCLARHQLYQPLRRFLRSVALFRLVELSEMPQARSLLGYGLHELLLNRWARHEPFPELERLTDSHWSMLHTKGDAALPALEQLVAVLLSSPHARSIVGQLRLAEIEAEERSLEHNAEELKHSLKGRLRVNKLLKQKQRRGRERDRRNGVAGSEAEKGGKVGAEVIGEEKEGDLEVEEEDGESVTDDDSTTTRSEGTEDAAARDGHFESEEEQRLDVERAKREVRELQKDLDDRVLSLQNEREGLEGELDAIRALFISRPFPSPFLSACLLLSVAASSESVVSPGTEAASVPALTTGSVSISRSSPASDGISDVSICSPVATTPISASTTPLAAMQEKVWSWGEAQSRGHAELHAAFAERDASKLFTVAMALDGQVSSRLLSFRKASSS